MLFQDLIRWSGLLALLSGVLLIIIELFALFTIDFGNLVEEANTPAFAFYSMASLLTAVLLLIGLLGLYFHQWEKAGTLGLAGFLVSFIGTALVVGAYWALAFGAPTIAVEAPDFLSTEPSGQLGLGFALSFWFFPLGWILFGVATLRARVFPRAVGVLLIAGAALLLIPVAFTDPIFAVAIIWMGYILWTRSGASSEQPSRTT